MERLTKREKAQLSNGEECVICNHEKADCNDSCMYGRCKWNKKAIEKLKAYEDKQEQGLLIELPCKVGDTVFLLMNGNTRIVECTVLWIEWHRNGTVVFSLDGGTGDVVMAHLGKKWFLTRSEAEEALAKMGGK